MVNPAAKHRMTLGVGSTLGGVAGGKRKEDEGIEIDGAVAGGSATVEGIVLAKMETSVIVVGNEGVTMKAIMYNLLLRNLALRHLWTRRCHLIECVHDESRTYQKSTVELHYKLLEIVTTKIPIAEMEATITRYHSNQCRWLNQNYQK